MVMMMPYFKLSYYIYYLLMRDFLDMVMIITLGGINLREPTGLCARRPVSDAGQAGTESWSPSFFAWLVHATLLAQP
jgi:hypothetical protein